MTFIGNVWSAAMDARGPLVAYPFHGDAARAAEECHSARGLAGRYLPVWERMLDASSAESDEPANAWMAGPGQATVADVAVWEVIDFYGAVFGEDKTRTLLESLPRLAALCERVGQLGDLAAWKDKREALFLPFPEYARVVRETLA